MNALLHFLGQVVVFGIIGPLFWLGVNVFEGWLQRKGLAIAGLDLFSRQSWREYLLRRRASRSRQSTGAHQRIR